MLLEQPGVEIAARTLVRYCRVPRKHVVAIRELRGRRQRCRIVAVLELVLWLKVHDLSAERKEKIVSLLIMVRSQVKAHTADAEIRGYTPSPLVCRP